MIVRWRSSVSSFALFACAACAGDESTADAGALSSSPAAADARAGEQQSMEASMLAWSNPAGGSIANLPVNELILHFSAPARLLEVTVVGPDGTMPTMVTAVDEVERYSLPLSGLGAGHYDVMWRASTRATEHRGSFGFDVR